MKSIINRLMAFLRGKKTSTPTVMSPAERASFKPQFYLLEWVGYDKVTRQEFYYTYITRDGEIYLQGVGCSRSVDALLDADYKVTDLSFLFEGMDHTRVSWDDSDKTNRDYGMQRWMIWTYVYRNLELFEKHSYGEGYDVLLRSAKILQRIAVSPKGSVGIFDYKNPQRWMFDRVMDLNQLDNEVLNAISFRPDLLIIPSDLHVRIKFGLSAIRKLKGFKAVYEKALVAVDGNVGSVELHWVRDVTILNAKLSDDHLLAYYSSDSVTSFQPAYVTLVDGVYKLLTGAHYRTKTPTPVEMMDWCTWPQFLTLINATSSDMEYLEELKPSLEVLVKEIYEPTERRH